MARSAACQAQSARRRSGFEHVVAAELDDIAHLDAVLQRANQRALDLAGEPAVLADVGDLHLKSLARHRRRVAVGRELDGNFHQAAGLDEIEFVGAGHREGAGMPTMLFDRIRNSND